MNNFELQVRAENGKLIGCILLKDGEIQISKDSGEDFRKATEYILNKKSIVSFWNGEKVVYARLQGGSLETLEILRDYLSHNLKFEVSLQRAVCRDPQLALFGQEDSSSIPLPIRRLKYFRSRSPSSAIRRRFQELERNRRGSTIYIRDLEDSDSEVHLVRDTRTNISALAA